MSVFSRDPEITCVLFSRVGWFTSNQHKLWKRYVSSDGGKNVGVRRWDEAAWDAVPCQDIFAVCVWFLKVERIARL